MDKDAKKIKRREARRRNNTKALVIAKEDQVEDLPEDISPDSESVGSEEVVQKDYYDSPMSYTGAKSWEEMDAEKVAREEAQQVREVSYSAQDLVSNILYSEMPPEDKASAIKKVGDGLGKRLKTVTKIEKAVDMDLLELQAILARDSRRTGFMEKMSNWVEAKTKTYGSVLPQENKSQVRYSLKAIVKELESGDPTGTYRAYIPNVKEAAKRFGIGSDPSILIEKDKTGSWRAVMFPTNNFKDRDGEIISEAAHIEYVDWINKNMDCAPVSMIWHTPGTARTHPFDFIGYENGFMVASLPLTENEAAAFMKMQIQTDIGLSIGGIAIERDPGDNDVITKYRMFEVSDLPLERASNPFTEMQLISKEAQMDKEKYLSELLGDDARAKAILEKMALSQAELRKAGVAEKEVQTPETPAATTVVNVTAPAVANLNVKEVLDAIKKELDIEGLNEYLLHLGEEAEKVPVLEALVKELSTSNEEKLAEMIQPPAQKMLVWQKARQSQKDENVLDPKKEEDKKLLKSAPEIGWLNQATNTQPLAVE